MLKIFQKSIEGIAKFFFPSNNNLQLSRVVDALEGSDDISEIEKTHIVQQAKIEIEQKINKDKRSFFENALENGVATLYLDPRVAGVVVPAKFAGNPSLILNYSYGYNISDFCFDDFSVIATLSFSRIPFKCIIPWNSVFGITNQSEGIFCKFSEFPEDIKEKEKPKLVLLKGGKE